MKIVMSPKPSHSNNRKGLIAVSEVMVMIVALIGLFWLGSQLIATIASVPAAAARTNACSDRRVYRLNLDKDGQRLWIYRPGDSIVRLDLATNEYASSMPLSGIEVSAVGHSGDGSTTLLCGLNGGVMLFEGTQAVVTKQLSRRDDFVTEALVSYDGATALCVTAGAEVVGWQRTDSGLTDFRYKLDNRSAMAKSGMNDRGTQLFVAHYDGTVDFLDPATGSPTSEPLKVDEDWRVGAECVAFFWSADEQLFGITNTRGQVCVYDLADRRMVFQTVCDNVASSSRPTAFVISPDNKHVAITMNTCTEVSIFDLVNKVPVGKLIGHQGIVRTVQFAPKTNRVYTGSYDGTVREWSLDTLAQVRTLD